MSYCGPPSGYYGPQSGYYGHQSGYYGPQFGYYGPQFGYYGHQSGYYGPQPGYPVHRQQRWCYGSVGPYCNAPWCWNLLPYAPPAPLQQVVVETPGRYEEPTSFMKPHDDPLPRQTLNSLTSSEAVEEGLVFLNAPGMETNGEEGLGDVESWLLLDPYHRGTGYM